MLRASRTVFVLSLSLLLLLSSRSFSKENDENKKNMKSFTEYKTDIMKVTVRKLNENPKDIPISFSVLGKKEIENIVTDIPSFLTRLAPNFYYSNLGDANYSFYTMRGIGLRPINPNDSTVGFSYDGVPTSLLGAAIAPVDLKRIEVLRGPQSVLYGRSTLGGAVNYVSNPITGLPEVNGRLEFGENGYFMGESVFGGALVPHTLFARGAVRYDIYGGDIPNGIIGGKDGNTRLGAVRASLKGNVDEKTKAIFHFFYDDGKRNVPLFLWKDHPSFPTSGSDIRQKSDRKIGGGSLTLTYDFDFARLTSVTGFSEIAKTNLMDMTDSYFFSAWMPSFSPLFFAQPQKDLTLYKQSETLLSQEIRLNSSGSESPPWVVGFSYMGSRYINTWDSVNSFYPTLNGLSQTGINDQTYGVFGEATLPLLQDLKFTAGGRLAQDRQTYKTRYLSNGFPGTVPSFGQTENFNDSYATGRASLSYDWTQHFMTYASIARGYSSEGFQAFPLNTVFGQPETPFEPSDSVTYELGAKSVSADGRGQLSASAFFNDISSGPIYTFNTQRGVFTVDPYDYQTQGFEFTGEFAVNSWLTLHGDVGYTHAAFVHVSQNPQGVKTGNTVPDVPNWTLNLNFDLHKPILLGKIASNFFLRPEYQYVGLRSGDPQNTYTLPSYSVVNVSLGFEGKQFKIYGFARNLTNKRYPVLASVMPGNPAMGLAQATAYVVGQGRIVGLGLTGQF